MNRVPGMSILLVLLSLVLWGCNPPPVITSFNASAQTIASGDQVRLSWEVRNASSISISPDVGAVTGSSITVNPTKTTEYTLTASNGQGIAQAKTTVTVNAPTTEPANFRVTTAGVNTLDFAWDASAGVSGYVLERQGAAGAYTKIADINANATSYTDSSLTKNTVYAYRLRAVRGGTPNTGVELRVSTASDTPVILADNTRVVDAASRAALQSFDAANGTLRFSSMTPQLARLKPGDLVVSEPGPNAPNGYLQKISSLRQDGAGLILETDGAALAETIQQGSVSSDQDLSDPNAYTVQPLVQGVALRRAGTIRPQAKADCQKNGTGGLTIDVPAIKIAEETAQNPDGTIKVVGKISAEGCMRLDPRVFFNLNVRPVFDVQSFEVGLAIAQEAQLKVNLEGSIQFKKSIEVVRLLGPVATFWIGPVPVVLQPSFVVSVGAGGKIEVKLTFGVKQESSVRVGVSYVKGPGWGLISNNQSNWTPISPADRGNIKLKFSLEAFADAAPGLTFYGTINVAVVAQVFAKFDWELPRNPLWKLTAGLRFGFRADLSPLFKGVKLELFSPDIELFKVESPNTPPNAPSISAPTATQQVFTLVPVALSGTARDDDDGDQNTLLLPCSALRWTSSNSLDAPLLPANACGNPTVTFQTPGTRTLTLTATDPRGASASSSVTVNAQPAPALRIVSPLANQYPSEFCSSGNLTLRGVLDGTPPSDPNDIRWSWRAANGAVTEITKGGVSVLNTTWRPGSELGPITLRLEVVSRALVFETPINLACIN